MTMTHGGWTDEQVAQIAEQSTSEQGAAASGFESFNDAAEAVPRLSNEFLPPNEPTGKPKRKPRASSAQKQASEALQQRFTAMRGQFAAALVKICDIVLTESMEMEPMTPAEAAGMKDALEFPLQVLDVEMAVEPINVSLTSFWWTLIIPVSMFLTVIVSRSIPNLAGGKDKKNVRTAGQEQAEGTISELPN